MEAAHPARQCSKCRRLPRGTISVDCTAAPPHSTSTKCCCRATPRRNSLGEYSPRGKSPVQESMEMELGSRGKGNTNRLVNSIRYKRAYKDGERETRRVWGERGCWGCPRCATKTKSAMLRRIYLLPVNQT